LAALQLSVPKDSHLPVVPAEADNKKVPDPQTVQELSPLQSSQVLSEPAVTIFFPG
jgi:hypothetical protein